MNGSITVKFSNSRHDVRTWILHSVLFMALMIMQLIGLAKAVASSLRSSRLRLFG